MVNPEGKGGKAAPEEKNELKQVISDEWTKIPISILENLALSMPRRLRECIDRAGYAMSY